MQDPSHVYWSADEIVRTINEALLYWGGLTSYWRERGTFNTIARTAYYDLSVQIPTLRSRTYTLGQLTTEIQYHLFEPPNGVNGLNMTAQFTVAQITNALIRKRNEFVSDSRIPLSVLAPFAVIPNVSGRVSL